MRGLCYLAFASLTDRTERPPLLSFSCRWRPLRVSLRTPTAHSRLFDAPTRSPSRSRPTHTEQTGLSPSGRWSCAPSSEWVSVSSSSRRSRALVRAHAVVSARAGRAERGPSVCDRVDPGRPATLPDGGAEDPIRVRPPAERPAGSQRQKGDGGEGRRQA